MTWYHGTPHTYTQPECPRERDRSCHWNALIGTHFTRSVGTATRFQHGLHHQTTGPGRLLEVPRLPGPDRAFSNEYQLEDTVAVCALRAGVFTPGDLERLWDYPPGSIDLSLSIQGLEQDLAQPQLYAPDVDHGSRLIGDLRDYDIPEGEEALRTAQVMAAITAFLVQLTAQGFTCITYLNTHDDETGGTAEETAILPHIRQVRGEMLDADELHRLFVAEHHHRMQRLALARTGCPPPTCTQAPLEAR